LTRKLHQVLGEEAAADLVNWTQQVDAQRAELRELNELNFSRLDARMGELELHMARFDARLGELREEMRVGFASMGRDMALLEARFERRFSDLIKWSFVFWVGAVGAIAILAGVLR
jgi:hypothetical protein